MGQEILYCFKCQTRLMGSDFEKGKAFRVDSQAACPDCVRDLLAHLPDPDAELEKLKRAQVPKPAGITSSSTKMQAVRLESTARMQVPGARGAAPEPPPPPPSRTPLLIAAVVGGLTLIVILAVVFSGSNETKTHTVLTPTPTPPDPGPRPTPRPDPIDPVARDLEELDARSSLLLRQEKIQEVAGILRTARGKSSAAEWTRGVDERLQKLEAAARRIVAPLLEQVGPAVKKGDQAALKDLRGRIEAFGVPALISDFDNASSAAASDPWIVLDLASASSQGGATLAKQPDGSMLASGTNPPKDTFTVSAVVGLRRVRAFRLEALPNPALPSGGPGRAANGNFVLSEFKVQSGGTTLAFSGASATFEQDRYPTSAAIDGNLLTGWAVSGRLGQDSTAIFHLQTPADLEAVTFVLENQTWHPQHVLGSFRISASLLEIPPPPGPRFADVFVPKTAEPPVSPAVLAYRSKWAAAARLAAARDFPAAAKALDEARAGLTDDALRKEAEADLADFKLAADALAEVPRLLPRWTKGTKIALEFISEGGSTERLEGTVLDSSARGLSVQVEGGAFDVPAGELAAASVAALMALRGEKKPTDLRAAAVLGALEGLAGADLPARFAGFKGSIDPKEADARRLFWSAEEDFAAMKTRGAAGAAFEKLLQEPTAFAARNKAFIDDRIAGTRDVFYFADDLVAAGTFSLLSSKTLESYWMSTADSPAGKAASNYLEAEVLVPPGATCRAWVYAGGCCQEVFTFYLQGTGLSGPSAKNPRDTVTAAPGGEEWIAVKPPSLSLKKKHTDHTGPKEPDRWTWIELGPLKFADAGPKKLRLLTEQKGFAVAYLAIGSGRQATPRDAEVKDLLRNRPGPSFGATGTILREIFRGISGDAVSDLTNNPKFKEGKPDESGMITYIDSWNLGDSYGCRIRGYVHPPVTGDYVFWIASDDHGELWLSADDTPAKKAKICSLNHAVGQRAWDADPSQKSQPVPLVGGKRYYIEVLQKQGGGGEHVAAGWMLPGGAQERPIPPNRLSPVGALPTRKASRPLFRGLAPDAPLVKSAYVGGGGGSAFEHAPQPRQFLRGLKYELSTSGCLRSLKPVYQGPGGDVEGAQAGPGGTGKSVIARPGYAVGGMIARGTDRLNAFKLVFMKVSGTRLVVSDRYESEWVGTRAGGAEVTLGDDGTPVIGIFGKAGGEIDGAGLLLQGK
ncbi:MAG: hypothetical protein HY293_18120 [Planctomycetes bacterium]|nr:hypothetical protein [Planctomycetota bacterium]